ncbi:Hypothetical predicted protein [Olea europaea subsp. europaea]|uniref:GRAM domain-containing protein n=1 Tax=Olea europaea subsp. europaea TaxID=158383 RepID=A0A8S0TBT9_OLEEU|nr:Hypothetical predicted protein [Olea europaea subsp. europaea]
MDRSSGLLCDPARQYTVTPSSDDYFKIRHRKADSVIPRMNKLGEWMENFTKGIREHGTKLSETLKGQLRLGARIHQVGGMEKVFNQNFNVSDGEKLLKASQCYLLTTAGPMAGLLFISTDKVAFCSER